MHTALRRHFRYVWSTLPIAAACGRSNMNTPDTRYAKTDDGAYLAYQTTGEGPIDIVWQFDLMGNIDIIWERPLWRAWLGGLADFSRLILHDRRGTGLSSRNVPMPNLETRVADLRVVLDAVGSKQTVLGGLMHGGAPNVLLAAAYPARVRALLWWEPTARSAWAPDYPWGGGPDYFAKQQRSLEVWGTAEYGTAWADQEESDGGRVVGEHARWAAMMSRHTTTPDGARQLMAIWWESDIRDVLASVQAPALLWSYEEHTTGKSEMEYIAALMPKATTFAMSGNMDVETLSTLLAEVRAFLRAGPSAIDLDSTLATVLFTDIVGSTERQASMGDRAWKSLIEAHHSLVREELARWRGIENDTAGDGFFATFDGPARAIRCALDVVERVRQLGIHARAGLHTGQVEKIDGKASGIAVSIGSRVAAKAGSSEVLVSRTVKDLVAGSGFTFEDRGEHDLKGVPERWRLYRVT
jgi:class 3 adenylate cyclase/pimeloyl-ACP methyl ester carboxylesterase